MSAPLEDPPYGSYWWLCREVGTQMGMPRDYTIWDHAKQEMVRSWIQSGAMRFYHHPPIPSPEGAKPNPPHTWSFLTPSATLSVSAGAAVLDLPDDFQGILEEFTIVGTEDSQRIGIVTESSLRQLQSTRPETGTPKFAAIRPKASNGMGPQKWEALLYPIPTTALQFSYRYTVNPPLLSEDAPWPLGGTQYAECLLNACLWVAEERMTKDGGGNASVRFMNSLAAAVQFDAQIGQVSDADVWPLNVEPGISITRGYLKRLIGRALGYGANSGMWSHTQTQEINLALQIGMRKFFHPNPIPGERWSHHWGFLKPIAHLTLVADQYKYDLPPDFNMIDGRITFAPGSSVLYPSIDIVGERQIAHRLQSSVAAGRPTLAAIVPKTPGAAGTGYELWVWPTPDGAYELSYRYQVDPDGGTNDSEIPYGGQPHAQTLIEACLAAVEEQAGKQGVHSKLFIERIAMSVAHDREVNCPATLGYNHDRSVLRDRNGQIETWHDCDENLITYNGVQY